MSELRKATSDRPFFISLTIVGWIDVFTRSVYCNEIITSLEYCKKNKGLKIYAYCIMSSHIHMIVASDDGNLSDILRDFKSYTAKRIIELIANNPQESRRDWLLYMFEFFAKGSIQNKQYQFWQKTSHPIELFSKEVVEQKINYIHDNPVAAMVVNDATSFVYSSANPDSLLTMDV